MADRNSGKFSEYLSLDEARKFLDVSPQTRRDRALTYNEALNVLERNKPQTPELGMSTGLTSRLVSGKKPVSIEPTWTPPPVQETLRADTTTRRNLLQKIGEKIGRVFRGSPEELTAKAQAAYAISQVTGDPMDKVIENLPAYSKALGIRGVPTTEEVIGTAAIGGIAAGLAGAPGATVLGVGGFMALDEIENFMVSKLKREPYKFRESKGLREILPEETATGYKDLADVADFIMKGAALRAVYKKAPIIRERLLRTTIQKYRLPRTVEIEAAKIKDLFQTGRKISPYEAKLVRDLGLSAKEYRVALDRGLTVRIPAEKVVNVVDRPLWAKFKKLIGAKPVAETKVTRAGASEVARAELAAPRPPMTAEEAADKIIGALEGVDRGVFAPAPEVPVPDIKEPKLPVVQEEKSTIAKKLTNVAKKLYGVSDLVQPYRDIEAEIVGKAVKKHYGYVSALMDEGASQLKDIGKELPDVADLQQASRALSDPTKPRSEKVNKIVNIADKFLTKWKEEMLKDGMKIDFVKNIEKRLKDNIEKHEKLLKRARKPENKAKYLKAIEEDKKAINKLKSKRIRYAPIPVRLWFNAEKEFGEIVDPKVEKKITQGFKIMRNHFATRKTIDIGELADKLVKKRIIEPEDTGIDKILTDYIVRASKIRGVNKIVKASEEAGMVTTKPPNTANWVKPRGVISGMFKDKYVFRPLAELLDKDLGRMDKGYHMGRVLGYIKGLQFTRFWHLGLNNLYQGFAVGSLRPRLSLAKDIGDAVKSVLSNAEDYQLMKLSGGTSQPYVLPFDEFQKKAEKLIKRGSLGKLVLGKMKDAADKFPVGALDTVMQMIWNVSWKFGDHIPRLVTFNWLLKQGYEPEEAGNMTALAHGDYARIKPGLRRIVNKLWFTPIFPYAMAIMEAKMLARASKYLAGTGMKMLGNKKWKDQGFKWTQDKKNKLALGAVLGIIAFEVAKDTFFRSLGFEREEYGLRYFKKYIDEETGQEMELVKYAPDPFNAPYRYAASFVKAMRYEDKMQGLFDRTRYLFFPTWRIAWSLMKNDRGDGNPIYETEEMIGVLDGHPGNTVKAMVDILKYTVTEHIQLVEDLLAGKALEYIAPQEAKRRQAEKRYIKYLADDLGLVGEVLGAVLPKMTFLYTRPSEITRMQIRIAREVKEFRRNCYRWEKEEEDRAVINERIRNFRDRLRKLNEELDYLKETQK